MGFYLRKSFGFGPVRLNLSRSGLGASVGVKGARLGITPKGDTYVHLGRGGLYYRQTLSHPTHQPLPPYAPPYLPPASAEQHHQLISADAQSFVDSSATDLLHEMNLVKRRIDLFPVALVIGAVLLIRTILIQQDWWLWIPAALTVALLSVLARHCDVTGNTLVLEYSLDGEALEANARLQTAMSKLSACSRIWRVDSAGRTYDWKRNAGATVTETRHQTYVSFGRPPKLNCNIAVPILKAGSKSLYFFPDRLLVYDSGGVGAISYENLDVKIGQTRFVETEFVPNATQVGTTWRFVNKDGGPDRRFNNNRLLPIMLYGELSLRNQSGLNEWFQCSVPTVPPEVSVALTTLKPTSTQGSMNVSFTKPENQWWSRFGLTLGLILMGATILVSLPIPSDSSATEERAMAAKLEVARQNQRKQQFVQELTKRFATTNAQKVTITPANDVLGINVVREGPKAAKNNGLRPLDKDLLFTRFLKPESEGSVCQIGFKTIRVTVNENPPDELRLKCP